MKVYVLSSGEYSDWTVRGIFSSMEEAQKVQADEMSGVPEDLRRVFRSDYNDTILEYELNNKVIPNYAYSQSSTTKNGYSVTIKKSDGTVVGVETAEIEDDAKPWEDTYGLSPTVYGFGPTVEHARRSAEEFRRVLLTTKSKG